MDSDPRVQGFLQAISTYSGVPVEELRVLWRDQLSAADHRGVEGLSSPVLKTVARREPTSGAADGGQT